ncbi:MAG: hypothetical protein AAF686_08790, partial [Pseudomonadota bacterium]
MAALTSPRKFTLHDTGYRKSVRSSGLGFARKAITHPDYADTLADDDISLEVYAKEDEDDNGEGGAASAAG